MDSGELLLLFRGIFALVECGGASQIAGMASLLLLASKVLHAARLASFARSSGSSDCGRVVISEVVVAVVSIIVLAEVTLVWRRCDSSIVKCVMRANLVGGAVELFGAFQEGADISANHFIKNGRS